jgi:hypothetical protein
MIRRRSTVTTRDYIRHRCPSGWAVTRTTLGLVLAAAAGLKLQEWWGGAVSPTAPHSPVARLTLIEAELFLGLWLLSGFAPTLAWRATLGCFTVFLAVALHRGISGLASCDCFGRLAVSPWATAALDAAAVGSLLIWRPLPADGGADGRRVARVAGLAPLLAVPLGVVLVHTPPAGLPGPLRGRGDVVALEPERWAGLRFPLLPYVDIAPELERGEWLVVLHRRGCAECRRRMPLYESLASRGRMRVALLEVPPFGPVEAGGAGPRGGMVRGHLVDSVDWFVQTPMSVRLRDGIVTDARAGGALAD